MEIPSPAAFAVQFKMNVSTVHCEYLTATSTSLIKADVVSLDGGRAHCILKFIQNQTETQLFLDTFDYFYSLLSYVKQWGT